MAMDFFEKGWELEPVTFDPVRDLALDPRDYEVLETDPEEEYRREFTETHGFPPDWRDGQAGFCDLDVWNLSPEAFDQL